MAKKNFLPGLPVQTGPQIQLTEPEVFILESLRFQDERARRFEGRIIADILSLCGRKPIYYYFRTVDELVQLADEFRASGYRYLHLSCHGNLNGIQTTFGLVSSERFSEIFSGILKNRRLFVSACSVGKSYLPEFVRERNKGMYSVTCPMDDIQFSRAAAIWTALYVRMFDSNSQQSAVKSRGNPSLKGAEIKKSLKNLCTLFDVKFKWSYHNAKYDKWVDEVINP